MSIFSSIANAEHTFAAWAEKELQKLYSEAPKVEQVINTVLTYVGPALQILVTTTAGTAAGTIVGSVIKQAQSDLTAVSGLIYDFGATPTVGSVVSSISTNLSALLTAGHITDATSVSTVTKITNELGVLATAIISATKAV